MFRDDHEAALARIAALEAELERERADDAAKSQRLAQLEHQLEGARLKLRATEEELVKRRMQPLFEQFFASNRPKGSATAVAQEDAPKDSSTAAAQKNPPKRSGIDRGALFVAVLLASVVVVGLLLIAL